MLNRCFFYCLALTLFLSSPSFLLAQSENEIVAVVNGEQLTQKEIDESIIGQLLPLQQQIFVLRKVALENLIIETLLKAEAKKGGISFEELRKSLTFGKVEVSTSEVEKEYLENASAFASMNPNEVRELVRLNLESRARIRLYREAIKNLKEQARIEIKHAENSSQKVSVDANGFSIGPRQASVNVVIFSDFLCPYCKESFKINKQILQEYESTVKFIYKHLPLQQRSLPLARASHCSGEQGRFWEYHDSLFASEDLSDKSLHKIAENLGLNLSNFKSCLDSEQSHKAVLKDLQEAKRLGIEGTPTFIINGRMFRGAIDLKNFRQIIEKELKDNQKSVGK